MTQPAAPRAKPLPGRIQFTESKLPGRFIVHFPSLMTIEAICKDDSTFRVRETGFGGQLFRMLLYDLIQGRTTRYALPNAPERSREASKGKTTTLKTLDSV